MLGNASWFEIPSLNFERAVQFYEGVFGVSLKREQIMGDLAIFPSSEDSVSGAILAPQADYQPTKVGATVYLNAGADLQPLLERAEKLGGEVLVPKTALPPGMGFFAHLIDSEGNRIGLHSMA